MKRGVVRVEVLFSWGMGSGARTSSMLLQRTMDPWQPVFLACRGGELGLVFPKSPRRKVAIRSGRNLSLSPLYSSPGALTSASDDRRIITPTSCGLRLGQSVSSVPRQAHRGLIGVSLTSKLELKRPPRTQDKHVRFPFDGGELLADSKCTAEYQHTR